jgi:ferredoxin
MRVVVDLGLCESNALCVDVCPEVFRVGDDDRLQILDANPPEALRARLEQAVRVCPKQAIAIVD